VLPSGLFLSGFPTKIFFAFLVSPMTFLRVYFNNISMSCDLVKLKVVLHSCLSSHTVQFILTLPTSFVPFRMNVVIVLLFASHGSNTWLF
jgi:hypothetical protein